MKKSLDIKLFIKATYTNLNGNNIFRIGYYVDIQADFSSGLNRPAGCGFAEKIEGTYVCVRYTPACDGGRRHIQISNSKVIPAVLYQDMMMKSEGRIRENLVAENIEWMEGQMMYWY